MEGKTSFLKTAFKLSFTIIQPISGKAKKMIFISHKFHKPGSRRRIECKKETWCIGLCVIYYSEIGWTAGCHRATIQKLFYLPLQGGTLIVTGTCRGRQE
jgi:hypothetical protein